MSKEYVSYKIGCCANCGNHNIEYCDTAIEGEYVYYYYTCPLCGGAGCETNKIEFECNTVIID